MKINQLLKKSTSVPDNENQKEILMSHTYYLSLYVVFFHCFT